MKPLSLVLKLGGTIIMLIIFSSTGNYTSVAYPALTPTPSSPLSAPQITSANANRLVQTALLGRGYINDVAWSPDGKFLAVATSVGTWIYKTQDFNAEPDLFEGHSRNVWFSPDSTRIATHTLDYKIQIFDLATRQSIMVLPAGGDVVALTTSWSVLATYMEYGESVDIWDITTGQRNRQLINFPYNIATMRFSSDDQLLALGGSEADTIVFDVATGQRRISLNTQNYGTAILVAFSPDNTILATARKRLDYEMEWLGNTVTLWDIRTGQKIRTFGQNPSGSLGSLEFTSNGSQIIVGHGDRLEFYNRQNGMLQQTLHDGNFAALNFMQTRMAVVGDGVITLWDMEAHQKFTVLPIFGYWQGDMHGVLSPRFIVFSPDGTKLAIAEGVDNVLIWDIPTKSLYAILSTDDGEFYELKFSPDGTTLLVASGNYDHVEYKVRLWDVASRKLINTISHYAVAASPAAAYQIDALAVSFHNGRPVLAVGSIDGMISVFDASSSQLLHRFKGHQREVGVLVFSEDGKILASQAYVENIKLWDIDTETLEETIQSSSGWPGWIRQFSPSGKMILTSSYNKLDFWHVPTGHLLMTLPLYSDNLAFSPDETLLLSPYDEKLWDIRKGKAVTELTESDSAAFSPDGSIFVLGVWQNDKDINDDGIWLFNTYTHQRIALLRGGSDYIIAIAFSPTGTTLATLSADDTVRLWRVGDFF